MLYESYKYKNRKKKNYSLLNHKYTMVLALSVPILSRLAWIWHFVVECGMAAHTALGLTAGQAGSHCLEAPLLFP